jgi:hypothetical protein
MSALLRVFGTTFWKEPPDYYLMDLEICFIFYNMFALLRVFGTTFWKEPPDYYLNYF